RPGGIFLCYVPTIVQSHQVVDALQRERHWALIETFETLYRPWNIEGQSVRPFHRMVAHTGFITVARRVVPEDEGGTGPRVQPLEPEAERAPEITFMQRYRRSLQVGRLLVIGAFVAALFVFAQRGYGDGSG